MFMASLHQQGRPPAPIASATPIGTLRRVRNDETRCTARCASGNAAGRLSDERYEMLSQTYEAEQKQLEAETARLRQEIEVQEAESDHLERFIEKARAYVGIKKLDGYILHELISAIYVSVPDKSSGHREQQHIRIEYNGIGFIPIHELMAKQTA